MSALDVVQLSLSGCDGEIALGDKPILVDRKTIRANTVLLRCLEHSCDEDMCTLRFPANLHSALRTWVLAQSMPKSSLPCVLWLPDIIQVRNTASALVSSYTQRRSFCNGVCAKLHAMQYLALPVTVLVIQA